MKIINKQIIKKNDKEIKTEMEKIMIHTTSVHFAVAVKLTSNKKM